MSKQAIIQAISKFINQRSGIEYGNYGERESFMGDYRPILKHGKQARQLLRAVELRDSITAKDIQEATRAYSGRLQLVERGNKVGVDYTTGQYFPTEYRKAACAVLAQCLWDYFRTKCNCETGDDIRRVARKEFGRGIAKAWFN